MSEKTSTSESEVADWLVGRITFYNTADEVTLSSPLAELGLDSVYVMTLCGDIEDTYGIAVDPTFFAGYETLDDLATGLAARLAAS
jgi:acyl carrier protein